MPDPCGPQNTNFYPRSPCGERRNEPPETRPSCAISIHALLAESDLNQIQPRRFHYHFYPRSPCGERPARRASRQQPAGISIHALLAESDFITIITICIVWKFLSTLSLRRATPLASGTKTIFTISIHALLAESDQKQNAQQTQDPHFYPRSPCGERHLLTTI